MIAVIFGYTQLAILLVHLIQSVFGSAKSAGLVSGKGISTKVSDGLGRKYSLFANGEYF